MSNLKLIVMNNCKEFGEKVNNYLQQINKTKENYIIPVAASRFSNGEGKVKIEESVRDKDLYIISDVGNYSQTYQFHGMEHIMSPDEHFQDIKRVIAATSGHASKINVVTPLLYQARQHKRKGRESLDCAIALQELEALGVNNIISFDVHDPNVTNAVPRLPFENIYPTNVILEKLITNEDIDDLLVISPDMGAMERARYYAEMLDTNVGVFYKRRDLSKVIDGKNPIVEHVYMGADVEDKNILIVDDMIASGASMIEVARELKEKGAKNIYLVATFALMTEGINSFIEAYKQGYFNKMYVANVSYVPEIIKRQEWYYDVDCSNQLAQIISNLNNKKSLKGLCNNKKDLFEKINQIKARK